MVNIKKIIVCSVAILGIISVRLYIKGNIMTKGSVRLGTHSFKSGKEIPLNFTCDGTDISPALHWEYKGIEDPQSYLLIMDDPDAQEVVGKTYVHWGLILSPVITSLPEGISSEGNSNITAFDPEAKELQNDAGSYHYQGPCPPKNKGMHTYRITLFALNISVEEVNALLESPVTAEDAEKHLKNHILAHAQITGLYGR